MAFCWYFYDAELSNLGTGNGEYSDVLGLRFDFIKINPIFKEFY